ncbi:MAG: hypothetical protein WBF42_14645, partial [Terracidiphilus sp.]
CVPAGEAESILNQQFTLVPVFILIDEEMAREFFGLRRRRAGTTRINDLVVGLKRRSRPH